MSILYAEGNKIVSEAVVDYLEFEGFKVDYAPNGVIAWEKFLTNPKQYDFILIDWALAIVSGYDFVKKVRAISETLPIMVVSNNATIDDSLLLHDLSIDQIHPKFTPIDELRKKFPIA